MDGGIIPEQILLSGRLPAVVTVVHVWLMRHPPQRNFPERPDDARSRRQTDTDSAVLAYKFRAALYGIPGGVALALGLGWKFGSLAGLIGLVLGWMIAYFSIMGLVEGAGRAAQTVYAPSGDSTPARREYSQPQAFRAAGDYAEAVEAYEAFVAEFPTEPEPYLQIAWILRDDLHAYADAARWLRRVRLDAHLNLGQDLMVAQELVDLYRHKLDEPQRAIPELARIADRVPGTPQAEAAKRELAELRAGMWGEQGDAEA